MTELAAVRTTPDRVVRFEVFGVPRGKGSLRGIPRKRRDGSKFVAMVESGGDALASWRQDVATMARTVYQGNPWPGAVSLELGFLFPRPKGHYRTGKHCEELKELAPWRHTVKPDIDKLTRCVLDAMTGILYRDDSQVDQCILRKGYADGDHPGLYVVAVLEEP